MVEPIIGNILVQKVVFFPKARQMMIAHHASEAVDVDVKISLKSGLLCEMPLVMNTHEM